MTDFLNPTGAFGDDDLESRVFSLRRPFHNPAATAIPAKTVVALNTSGGVVTAVTNGAAQLAVGVTNENIEAGGTGLVTVLGVVEAVPISGDASAGDLVIRSATTAGRVAAATTTAAAAGGQTIGVAIADATTTNGTVDVWVFKA